MKTIAKSIIILAALVSLASCNFFKKDVPTTNEGETAVVETTTGINVETTEASVTTTTTTGIAE